MINKILARIEKIEHKEQLTIVTFSTKEHQLKMMSLELSPATHTAKELLLTTKATNIALAKNYQGELSYSNQLQTTVKNLEMGELLCSVELLFEGEILESVITADSAKRMNIAVGDKLTALIKSSDISIMEVIS